MCIVSTEHNHAIEIKMCTAIGFLKYFYAVNVDSAENSQLLKII